MMRYDPKSEDFAPLTLDEKSSDSITRPPIGYWQDVWMRFRKNKLALTGLAILALLGIMAIIGPIISSWDYRTCDYGHVNEFVSSRHWFGTDYLVETCSPDCGTAQNIGFHQSSPLSTW